MKQIKVEDTRMHNKNVKHYEDGTPVTFKTTERVLVAEAKLVLVEEYNPSRKEQVLWRNKESQLLYTHSASVDLLALKPILISQTEKIEEGDWYLHYNSGTKEYTLFKADAIFNDGNDPNDIDQRGNILPYGNKKVIALPEHFSPKHLQAIVDGKLKDGDKVLVECEWITRRTRARFPYEIPSEPLVTEHDSYTQIKLNSSNYITLHKIEEKTYTKDQMIWVYEEGVICGKLCQLEVKSAHPITKGEL